MNVATKRVLESVFLLDTDLNHSSQQVRTKKRSPLGDSCLLSDIQAKVLQESVPCSFRVLSFLQATGPQGFQKRLCLCILS